MNNYIDIYGRYHDKPCKNDMPSSNNGWIYTAYAQKAGLPVDMNKLERCMNLCRTYNSERTFMAIYRSPGKASPPISRDEVLGMAALKLIHSNLAETKHWNFSPFPLPKFSLTKLVKQLWEIRPSVELAPNYDPRLLAVHKLVYKHRNYFWENNLDQLYRFAFSVPLQDRHFMLKKWGMFSYLKPSHVFYSAVAKIDSLLPKKSGIKWLKYGTDIGEALGPGDLEHMKEMVKEFPTDHPIRVYLEL